MGIVASLERGDHAAFTRLVEEYDSDMVRLCFVICGDVELARDATQNAWHRLWRDPPHLRNETRLRSWLLSVAANEARQLARRRRRGAILEREAAARVTEEVEVGIDMVDLDRALAGLSPDERELLGLRYVIGLTSSEIGRHLGLTAEGVRTRLHRLLTRLRTELNG